MQDLSRRPYNSPRRAAAALATRVAVIEAADALFVSRGYGGTTLAAVAEHAGVSLATVKLVAATKGALLLEAFRARVRGDAAQTSERSSWQEMLAEQDSFELLRRWVALTRSAHERTAALFEVFWQAGPSEHELAKVYQQGSASRRQEFGKVIDALADRGALRPDVDADAALDIAWALNSPLMFRQFIACGWTPERWEGWLVQTMSSQILTAGANGAA